MAAKLTKKTKGAHVSDKNARARYKATNQHSTNRRKDLEKHIANHPEDANAVRCMEQYTKMGFPYRRRKSTGTENPKSKKSKNWGCYGWLPLTIKDQLSL